MTNYLQILTAALAFNLQFPNYLSGLLTSAQKAGKSSGVFLSFDWLLMDTKIVEMFDNVAFLKVLCIAVIPILLILLSFFMFRLWFWRDSMKFKRYFWVTTITIFFLLHPTLTQFCLRIFKWVEIGNGQRQVEMDIVTEWWSGTHIKWIIILGKFFMYHKLIYSYTNASHLCHWSSSFSIHNFIYKQEKFKPKTCSKLFLTTISRLEVQEILLGAM